MKIIVLIIFVLTLAGCAVQESVRTRNGKQYGITSGAFRERSWNYYERGRSYAEGEFYEEAIRDFKAAISYRMDDNWRSRTYGMHFIDYFPHRELGIVYYRLKRFDDAVKELEYSLKTAESAKASFFLNKTRKSVLELTGRDTLPPSVRITYPYDGMVTRESNVVLKGEAEDDFYVSSLSVNNVPRLIELATKKVGLEQELPLKRGRNEIRVMASDLTGKTAEKTLTVHVDREGPVIIIKDMIKEGRSLILDGFITDSTRVRSFSVNGRPVDLIGNVPQVNNDVPLPPGQGAAFHLKVEIPENADAVLLEAEDSLMNITGGKIFVPETSTKLQQLPLLALAGDLKNRSDNGRNVFAANVIGTILDDAPPKIRIKDPAAVRTVYTDSFFLEGSVSDTSRVSQLRINGESILKRKGKKIFFNYFADLKEGENIFLIEASDMFGNSAELTITVHRNTPKVRQLGSRMSISVLPFIHKGTQSLPADTVYDSLLSAFVNQKRFRMIERSRLEDVLRELKLGMSDLVNPGTAAAIGEIVSADAMLVGTVYESVNAVEVYTRLIDTETSDIIAAEDVFDEDKSFQGINSLMAGLALKFKQHIPLLEGTVLEKDGTTVLTNLGTRQNIKRNMRLILFREENETMHALSGEKTGGEPVELGEAKINRVYDETSRAEIKRGDVSAVREKDRVITK